MEQIVGTERTPVSGLASVGFSVVRSGLVAAS
jgi:hypothetical protein